MPPKKAKKKPPKPPLSSTSSNDKNPTKPSAAAKKKELADGKKTEIKQLQDSLSSFFTPTGSRRSRHPPVEVKTVPESSIERSHSPGENVEDESSPEPLSPKPGPSKESPPKKVSSSPKPGPSRVFQCQKASSSPKPGPSRILPCDSPPREEPEPGTTIITYRTGGNEPPRVIIRKGKPIAKSSSSPEPCSSKTTAAELAAKKSKRKAIQLRKPGNLPRGYKAGKASSSSSEDDGCGDGSDHPTRFMPNPSYYYKGYYFRECPNAPQEPDQATPIQLIETLKSMEEINRLNPDYREYEVDSDTEYEPEPDPEPSEFDSWNEYLVEKCKPRKMVKVIDGMTRPQRREHRQFALEFKDLIDALKDNHMAYCDGTLRKFSKPFDPPEGWSGRTSEQILQQAKARMEAALNRSGANVQFISDPSTARDPNPDNSPPSSPSSSSSSSSEDSDDESDKELVNFRQKFSEMDLKPLINMKGMNWRELLPPKPPKEGEEEVSSESSVTTDSDDDPKPLQWEVAGTEPQTRPPEWERYRSTNERVIYRRYIRRACRNILKSNKRKKKIHKFLQIGTFAPPRPIPEPPTRIPEAIVDDDELMEIPNYMGIRDILNGADPEQRSLLIKAFNETHRMDVRRIREYDKAAAEGPVPKFIYISKYQMKTLYTSPLPFHLRIKDELFLCDQCLDGWIERDTYERHTKVCQMKRPPGKMVYKDEENRFAFFEVDALTYPSYCQMLCCLGISYIEHKSLHTDIEPFLFYVLAKKEKERDFYHFIGYFSKQKYGHSSCNLCCLLVLPCYQGKGYGRYIIDFSFLLSRVEKIPGTPERPLSEAADYLYYRYYYESFLEMVFSWWQCNERDGIDSEKQSFNLGIIEQWTGICKRDMLKVLHSEGMVDVVRFPEDPTKQPKLKFNIDQQELIEHMEKQIAKKNRYWIKKAYLNWKPDFGTIEERMHFPLIQEEYEAREAGLLFQNPPADGEEEEDEEPESPPKPAKKGRKKKGEKKVAKPKKKKMVVRFLHGDTNEEFDAKNPFEDLTRSQVFTNKDFLYQTLPYTRPLKKQKKRPTTTGKRRKPKKKKELETKKKGEEEESEEEEDIPNLFTDPDDDEEEEVAAAEAQASEANETIAEEPEAEEEEPQPCSSKTPIKPAPKTKPKKTVAKKKSPPKRRGRKPSGAAGSSCKDKSPKRKKPESSDEDSDDEDRRPARPRGRKRTTTPKTKKAESEAQTSEPTTAEAPSSSNVAADLPKSSTSPLKQTLKASSDEEDSEGHQMVINVREDSSESDDDDSRPLPLQKPHEYHVFSPPLDEAFQMSPTNSPRRSQKRSSRNRSVSFSRNPKESRTSSDYDESNIPPPQPLTTTTSPSRTLAVIDHNVLKMEFGNESVNIYQNQQPQQENVLQHHHLQHQQQQHFPYSTNNRSNASGAAEKPGKEETEMPKLLPTALEVPIQRMEINDNGERNNDDEDDDDDDVDDDAPPMLSPNFATANTNHSPLDEAGEFTPPNLHNNSSNEQPPPMMEAPPMLQNTSSIPKVESVPSHRAPESLQNSGSRRSSTEMQQQSHSVPSQSMNLQQHQMPLQQQIQQQQAWQLQNEMYNSQAAPQQQQIPQQLIHEQQPRSHPQQMTPQQPASMAMSDPNSVYSMHSVQSQPSTMPPHLPPPPPPQQQPQQQMHYPPLQQEARKSLEQQQLLTHPQQLLQQQLQQQTLQPLPPQPEPPKPKPKPKKKKKESTSSSPTSASFSNPMFPQQKYPNPYDAAFGGFFPPSYMAAAQMAQFQGHGGYANYPNPYSSTMPTPTNYQNQQFNTFNAWAGNSTPGYPGYPPFMPQTAGAAAVAAVAQQQHNQSAKLYSQFRGNAIAAMGGAGSSSSGAGGTSGAGPSSAGIPQNPNANLFPTNAAAAAAAAQWNPMSQNPPPPNPYNLPPYSYFPQ